jgi:hypothetical protein
MDARSSSPEKPPSEPCPRPEQQPSTTRTRPTLKTTVDADGRRVLPSRFELCETEDLIELIGEKRMAFFRGLNRAELRRIPPASMLDRLIEHNDNIPLLPDSLTRFHSRVAPSISVREYLARICRFVNVEHCCLLILLCYVDKVCERLPGFTISSLTVHRCVFFLVVTCRAISTLTLPRERFVIASVAVGSKALSDSFFLNGRYARVGGITLTEMNLLERELLSAIDWRLTVGSSYCVSLNRF